MTRLLEITRTHARRRTGRNPRSQAEFARAMENMGEILLVNALFRAPVVSGTSYEVGVGCVQREREGGREGREGERERDGEREMGMYVVAEVIIGIHPLSRTCLSWLKLLDLPDLKDCLNKV